MKKIILFLLLSLSLSVNSYSQLTPASVEGYKNSRSLTFTNPVSNSSETRIVGLCFGKIYNPNSGPDVCYYSIDIVKAPGFCMPNFDYVDDSVTILLPKVCYIIHSYYPAATGPGQLGNLNNETAAIQAVIWHYTNGLNLTSITSTTVKNRALAIKANVDANGTICSPSVTFEIVSDSDPDFFLIRTTNDNGSGIAVNNIQLSISEGSLSQTTVNTTAPSGYSVPVQVIGTGTGVITAYSDNIEMPRGTIFRHTSDQCPKVVLACPGPGAKRITSDWGALPVELTSFSGTVIEKNITLNWATASELNNSHFDIERRSKLSGEWISAGRVSGNGTSSVTNNYTFTDRGLSSGRYNYRLKQVDFNGNFEYFNLSNEIEVGAPGQYELNQNFPNPFNPSTKISFDLPKDGNVSIKVFDNSGREVAELVNEFRTAGYYTVNFVPSNISSGIYFYRMDAGGFVKVMKMALVK